jgi:YHS domain-containing protein
MIEDPVCGMELTPDDAVAETDYGGETYYFCSDECRAEFDRDPERYATSINEPAF